MHDSSYITDLGKLGACLPDIYKIKIYNCRQTCMHLHLLKADLSSVLFPVGRHRLSPAFHFLFHPQQPDVPGEPLRNLINYKLNLVSTTTRCYLTCQMWEVLAWDDRSRSKYKQASCNRRRMKPLSLNSSTYLVDASSGPRRLLQL